MSAPLDQRVILVTGAGGALGSAIAEQAAAQGATVILLGRRQKPLEATYDRIVAAGGVLPFIFPCDLAVLTAEQAAALAQALTEQFGALHGLVHCAASVGALCPWLHTEPDDWQRGLALNLTAPFLLTRALLPLLTQSGHAEVLFLTNPAAHGKAYWGAYGVAQAGLVQLLTSLAQESDGQVRINGLAPAPFFSPLRRRCFPGEKPDSLPRAFDVAAFAVRRFHPNAAPLSGQIFDAATIAAALSES